MTKPCRFADEPGHVCARRDGRPIRPAIEDCHREAAAQLADLQAQLRADSDACMGVLVRDQDQWQPVMRIIANRAWEDKPVTLIAVPRDES